MRIFVVNLARRRDRLSVMTAQLRALKLAFDWVQACDAKDASDDYLDQFVKAEGPLGALPKGDRCCFVSHMRAWNAFLQSGESHGVILEDDVGLDPASGDLLLRPDWIPAHVDLLKLEHFGPERQLVLVGEPVKVGTGRTIAEIRSRHTGAGAYVLSRWAAQHLLSFPRKWSVSVDHVLFNPNVSPLAREIRPYQLLPAIARQDAGLGGASDIAASRMAQRRPSVSLMKREMMRAFYEVRLLPQQIGSVITGRAWLARVRNDVLLHRHDRPAPVAELRMRQA